jgi:hypothetical protein
MSINRFMKFILTFFLITLLSICNFWSQENKKSIYNNEVKISPIFSINNDFNLQDWYLGASGGIEDIGYQWGAKLSLGFRPFRKKIQLEEPNNIIRQYRERKVFLSLDIDKRLGHFDLFGVHTQFYFGSKNGVLFGNYSGTKRNAEPVWVIAPFGGICFNFDDVTFIKIGYMFLNDKLYNVDNNRISFTYTFLLNQN